ncbi:MAG: phosphodiester glycosidase family protein, partial [Solobacterium sp.]|nr:phosphodiester glycosidase family protein [Solobacterium sp.]
IGQRPDGTFLLLVLDGRGPSSFGAKYQDIVDVMFDYGAYMASNLDGGNSTAMIYNGEYVNKTVSMYGSRHLPTAFIVMEGE